MNCLATTKTVIVRRCLCFVHVCFSLALGWLFASLCFDLFRALFLVASLFACLSVSSDQIDLNNVFVSTDECVGRSGNIVFLHSEWIYTDWVVYLISINFQ